MNTYNKTPWEQISNQNQNVRTNLVKNGALGAGGTVILAGRQYNKMINEDKFSKEVKESMHNFTPMKRLKDFWGRNKQRIIMCGCMVGLVAALGGGLAYITAKQEVSHDTWVNNQPQYSDTFIQNSDGPYNRLAEQAATEKQNQDTAALAVEFTNLVDSGVQIPDERIMELASDKQMTEEQQQAGMTQEQAMLASGNQVMDQVREYEQYPDETLKTIVNNEGMSQNGAIASELLMKHTRS